MGHPRISRAPRRQVVAALILTALVLTTVWFFAGLLLGRYDFDCFVNELQAAGATVELPLEPQPDLRWFPVPPRTVLINGYSAQVFQFSSKVQTLWASCHVLSNGQSIAPMQGTQGVSIGWAYPGPRWYRKGQLIVIYRGSDPNTNQIIEQLVGSPFTGGPGRGAPCGIPL
jgi:hypothetical protein